MSSGSSLGGIVYPIMMSSLVSRIGFGWTVRSIAFLMLIMLLVANVTVKSRLRPVPSPVRLSQFTALFRECAFGLTCLGSFLFCLGMFLPFNFISMQAQAYGISANAASYLVVVLNGSQYIGPPLSVFQTPPPPVDLAQKI
jgi:hypothetical protein